MLVCCWFPDCRCRYQVVVAHAIASHCSLPLAVFKGGPEHIFRGPNISFGQNQQYSHGDCKSDILFVLIPDPISSWFLLCKANLIFSCDPIGRIACGNIHASEFCTASREREDRGDGVRSAGPNYLIILLWQGGLLRYCRARYQETRQTKKKAA